MSTAPEKRRIRIDIPGYKIVAKLGQGGMGAVFKAIQLETNREVAIKILAPNLARNEKFVERFEREGKLAAELKHPNAVEIVGMGVAGELHYIAMEFIDGESVDDMLKRGPIEQEKAIRIVIDAARALAMAHSRGIIHRDIKPANIMVTRAGVAKLCDLGVGKQLDDSGVSLTKTGTAMGTPAYVSPEQIMDAKRADARSDIYSLGATLYHMVTGRRPFEADTAYDMMVKQATEPPKDPREANPNLSTGLSRIILHAMAKRKEERYQTLEEMIADLEAVLAGKEPTLGRGAAAPAAEEAVQPAQKQPAIAKGGARLPWVVGGVVAAAIVLAVIAWLIAPTILMSRTDSKASSLTDAGRYEEALAACDSYPQFFLNDARRKQLEEKRKAIVESALKVVSDAVALAQEGQYEKARKIAKGIAEQRCPEAAERAKLLLEKIEAKLKESGGTPSQK